MTQWLCVRPSSALSRWSRQTCECQRADSKGQEFLLLGCQEAQVARVPDIVLASHGAPLGVGPQFPTVLSEVTTTVDPPHHHHLNHHHHVHTQHTHLHRANCEGFPRRSGDGLATAETGEQHLQPGRGGGHGGGGTPTGVFLVKGFELISSEKEQAVSQQLSVRIATNSFPPL